MERQARPRRLAPLAVLLLLVLLPACATNRAPRGATKFTREMEVTAYCPCGKCCGWERNWRGKPVIAYGPNKGKPKKVGITASGEKAKPGTIAADTSKYPFGTVMSIPGYGKGTVQDRGGAIQGEHIDLFFKKHNQALQWGRQRLPVTVWLKKP